MSKNASKKQEFLELLEKVHFKGKRWDKYGGPGLKKKIKRLIYIPDLYLPYLLFRKVGYLNDQEVEVDLFWNKNISLNLRNDYDAFLLYAQGYISHPAEYKLTKFLVRNFNPNDVFYDVGASYGFYSHLALEFCKEIHSFEPNPEVFRNLRKNFSKNANNVFLNEEAVLDNKKTSSLFLLEEGSGRSTTNKKTLQRRSICQDQIIQINSTTLDEYLVHHSIPSFIKIDVEGAENKVIKGGEDTLKNNSPVVSIEVWSQGKGGEISMKAVRKLRKLNYRSYYINRKGTLESVSGDLSQLVQRNSPSHENFVFKK